MTSTLLQLIDKQAAKNPGSEAVRWQGESLSYGELVAQSTVVAQALAKRGIGSSSRVGLSLSRGLDLAIGLLGIYRSGAAYVPLDPLYPAERLLLMVSKADLSFVIADEHCPLDSTEGLSFGRVDALLRVGTRERSFVEVDSKNGYIIFTSGSTGTPKGVELGRHALENLVHWQRSVPGLSQATSVLQFTPTSFDVHYQEFFGTWVTGGTLVLVDDDTRRDPQQLAKVLVDEGIGRLFLPFVALRQLADVVVRSNLALPRLQDVVTAGEQLVATDNLRRMFTAHPNCRLHNHYGPSETHVATAYRLPLAVDDWLELPPIGQPIAKVVVEILNQQGSPVAQGEEGELYLGGACLAEGYINEPELTSERFVTLPNQGSRFYRTGDLVAQDAAGELHYRGRADKQIKIRGYRVEIGEIEARLNQHDGIQDSVVVAQATLAGDKRLIAYLVPDLQPAQSADSSLDGWRQVWDQTYNRGQHEIDGLVQLDPNINATFDIRGWNSSYTGNPLGESAMREWVEGTRDRILALQPKRLLEVGAGTGLILFAVQSKVDYYHATDYSASAIRQLEQTLKQGPEAFEHCRASCEQAHQLAALAGEAFDTVVINSVTQHFESSQYLEQVLTQAISVLESGGSIFLGDITAFSTREMFFADVEATRGGTGLEDQALAKRVAKRQAEDRELTLDAEFFFAWAKQQSRITCVSVQLKPGAANTELTNFRFDVTLTVAPVNTNQTANGPVPANVEQRSWDASDNVESIRSWLDAKVPQDNWALRINGISNVRLQPSKAQWSRIAGLGRSNVTSISSSAPTIQSIDPDSLLELANELGLEVQTWFDTPGELAAVFPQATAKPLALKIRPTSVKPIGLRKPAIPGNRFPWVG